MTHVQHTNFTILKVWPRGKVFFELGLDYSLVPCPYTAPQLLLNSGFRILTLSSHVVPGGITLPFELLCHRHTDEIVIIATRPNFLGKKACPSDTLPVLWRGQWRDGFAGAISKVCLWCLWERRWRGFKDWEHAPPPNQSPLLKHVLSLGRRHMRE